MEIEIQKPKFKYAKLFVIGLGFLALACFGPSTTLMFLCCFPKNLPWTRLLLAFS
jgi:hypothetical protein